MRLIEATKTERLTTYNPIWWLIDEDTQKRLTKYQRRKYHGELNPPEKPVRVIVHDVAREMSQAPESEEHMREKK